MCYKVTHKLTAYRSLSLPQQVPQEVTLQQLLSDSGPELYEHSHAIEALGVRPATHHLSGTLPDGESSRSERLHEDQKQIVWVRMRKLCPLETENHDPG